MSEPDRPIPFPASLPPQLRGWGPFGAIVLSSLVLIGLTLHFGIGAAILLLASVALLTVIGMAFRAVQGIAEPDEDAGLLDEVPTPAAMEKQIAFKALKDLEFERSVGNIGDADYAELHARYREEAKRAMRAVDDERRELRARAEKMASDVLEAQDRDDEREAPSEPDDAEATEPPPSEPAPAKKPAAKAIAKTTKVDCADCGTKNDPDAKFCKSCGAKMGLKEAEA